jgi:hypothetical protein
MFVYSREIIRFVHEIKAVIKNIFTKEIRLKCTGNRFYDRSERYSYPINVVIYNNKSMLGYFESEFYELGFHERLMRCSKDLFYDIIRHELAHYMTFLNHGHTVQPHSAEFKEFCKKMGWGERVYKATIQLDSDQTLADAEEGAVLRKVKKLMALTASSDKNEAEQAMIKSQQLLLKYNLESNYAGCEEEKIFMKRIMKQKRETAKMRGIAEILKTFFVSIVYHRGSEGIYLEILGSAVNLEIAEHVAFVLDSEFESLWVQAKKEARLKGAVAKNSFFMGIAKGYCNKISALKKTYTAEVAGALVVLEKQLIEAQAMAYPHLSSRSISSSYCSKSSALGEKMGRQLNIRPGINERSRASQAYLDYKP